MSGAHVRVIVLLAAVVAWAAHAGGQTPTAPPPTSQPGAVDDAALEALLTELGDADYLVREAATFRLMQMGTPVGAALRARLQTEPDEEVCFRLHLILENLRPPDRAALVVRADIGGRLRPGDVITHVNNQRVRAAEELGTRMTAARAACTLRVRGASGPRAVGPLAADELPVLCNYRAPRGEIMARLLRLYDTGYAERAYELLQTLDGPVAEDELSPLLHAVLAYTAGDGATALRLLADCPDACQPWSAAYAWRSPSALDLSGPGKAPFHLEWLLWTAPGLPVTGAGSDPDTAVQRVLVPASRFQDALLPMATLWWLRYRETLGAQSDVDRVGGNMLAVAAWMLAEMDLLSECLRLVEPRSEILRRSPQGVRKWLRIRTDAWLALVRGDARGALDGFYEDARAILRVPGPRRLVHIQNPQVAAAAAFFLYQFPQDERVEEMYELVNQREHPVLGDYARWMLLALRAENFDLIHKHLVGMLANASDADAGELAWTVALLEYVGGTPDRAVLDAVRERLADAGNAAEQATRLALIDALEYLAAGRLGLARQALDRAGDAPGAGVLRATIEFRAAESARADGQPAWGAPLLAVPIGTDRSEWLLLTREWRLMRLRLASGELTPVDNPTPNWLPGPLNWPWLGREPATGRVWAYGRRRVAEVCGGEESAVALNVRTEDITGFDRYVGPVFSTLSQAIAAVPAGTGERSEFWCEDLRAAREYFADPGLPELGLIRVLPGDERMVHVAFRGGPHLLVDASAGKCWSSVWIAEQLGLERPPGFLAQAARAGGDDASPIVFLLSDAGLLRFDVGPEKVARVALPGDDAYPAVVPESCPYERRDPRWVYCARLPEDGGQVFRVTVADNHVATPDMINEALSRDYYAIQSRAVLRARIDAAFMHAGLPPLRKFVADVEETVSRYAEEDRP